MAPVKKGALKLITLNGSIVLWKDHILTKFAEHLLNVSTFQQNNVKNIGNMFWHHQENRQTFPDKNGHRLLKMSIISN